MPDEAQIGVGDLYRKLDVISDRMDARFDTFTARFEELLRNTQTNDATFELRLSRLEKVEESSHVEQVLSKRHRAQLFWGIIGSTVVGLLGVASSFLH